MEPLALGADLREVAEFGAQGQHELVAAVAGEADFLGVIRFEDDWHGCVCCGFVDSPVEGRRVGVK
jgi:hypothetical protein